MRVSATGLGLSLAVVALRLQLVQLVTLYAPFDAIGLKGNVSFSSDLSDQSQVRISVNLVATEGGPRDHRFQLSIHANPVFFGTKNACSKQELGSVIGKLSDKHGLIELGQVFNDQELSLTGLKSIWSRSLLIQSTNSSSLFACANIFHDGAVKTSEAIFTNQIAGSVIFRENELGETFIYSNLFQTGQEYRTATKHDWKIMVTDILDTRSDRVGISKCNYLSQLLDPDNVNDKNCTNAEHNLCKMGDLTRKHGQVTIGSANNRYSKLTFVDGSLPISAYLDPASARQVYLVIYEKRDRVLTCARVSAVRPREVRAEVNMDGVRGFVRFSQRYKTDPTVVTINLMNLMGRGKWYHVHQYPVPTKMMADEDQCSDMAVGGHFNPFGIRMSESPPASTGTVDQYEVGDLSGKYGALSERLVSQADVDAHLSIHVDMNLPLFGINSIVGRSLVIHRPDGRRWICATIGYPDEVITLEATFKYPIVGKVIFRQLADEPLSETTVFAELTYSDSTVNDTTNHAWHIHERIPGLDFYNWSRRCASAGDEYNPFEVGSDGSRNAKCTPDNAGRCAVGDLTSKGRRLSIAAYRGSSAVKLFYTDGLLPLSGPGSIEGKSIVVHDDAAPVLRGNRMACTGIKRRHPLQASVRRWRVGAGLSSNVSGQITFRQPTEEDQTRIRVDLHGLNGEAGGYHIHQVGVPLNKEFACSQDSVYGHYNPLNVDISVGPLPGAGTSDQYEVGDLSGKFGKLDFQTSYKAELADASLPLHGLNSIVGRSIVINRHEKEARWVCGTIEPVIDRKSTIRTREIVGLASFDDPRHLVQGFVRFRQFEYADGSVSTTFIEHDIRYPGVRNRNVTEGHGWAIFVNQVGEDAYNFAPTVKCLAAGYRWNPYLADATNVNYARDCGPRNPLRCEMGDLSGRHGKLVIGGPRRVFADDNLPLVGNFSIMGRSLVVLHKNGSDLKMACANIKPDVELVSSIAVKKHPTFTVARFMDHMHTMLNTTSWLVVPDLSATKLIVDGECVQLSIHFYGADAHKNQVEFSNLLNLGSVKQGYRTINTHYKPCRSLDELNNPQSSSGNGTGLSQLGLAVLISALLIMIYQ